MSGNRKEQKALHILYHVIQLSFKFLMKLTQT